jgi:hypothetical protein
VAFRTERCPKDIYIYKKTTQKYIETLFAYHRPILVLDYFDNKNNHSGNNKSMLMI